MKTLSQINMKNRPHYILNDMINVKNFDSGLLSIDKILFKSTDDVIYQIKYIIIKSIDYEKSLYLILENIDGYIEFNSTDENKYFIFVSTDKSKEVLAKFKKLWYEIKNQIETVNGRKLIKYGRDVMKSRFESDDDLPLDKILSIPTCIIAVGFIIQKDSNYYLQAHLHECLYEYLIEL